jgi:hypothetical protein
MSGYQMASATQNLSLLPEAGLNLGTAKVSCPAGKQVVGGGYRLAPNQVGGLQLAVESSFPDTSASWSVGIRNRGTGVATFSVNVYAICVYVD